MLREYMVAMSVYAEVFQNGLPADSPTLIDIVTRRRLAKNWVRKRSEYMRGQHFVGAYPDTLTHRMGPLGEGLQPGRTLPFL